MPDSEAVTQILTGLLKALVHGFTNLVTKKICALIRNGITFGALSFLYLPSCDVCCAAFLIITYHILCV